MRQKVLILITKATYGGAQKFVFDEATKLQRENIEPVVIYGEEGMLLGRLKSAGIETHRSPALARDVALISDIASFFQIYRYIGIMRPDEIHLNSSKAAGIGALAARLYNMVQAPSSPPTPGLRRAGKLQARIIFTVHGWPFKERRNAVARAGIYFASWLTALMSHEVRVVSKKDEDLGKRMWGIAKKIRYVPLSLAPPEFLARAEAERALSIHAHSPRIVTIAELTPNKGITYAIEAMEELQQRGVDAAYYVIGEGEEAAALARLASERGLRENVHFLGFVPDAAKYLKAFDVFLLPSIKEGMPYVLLEAAQAKLPIVTTDIIDPEFLEKNPGAVAVRPANPMAIADAIARALLAT